MLDRFWQALTGQRTPPPRLRILEPAPWLGGSLPCDELARAAVAAALLAAGELALARGGRAPEVELDAEHVALSFHSERLATVAGRRLTSGFAPLSRFVRCRDGWLRTHGNYPHHERALREALDLEGAGEDPLVVSAAFEAAAADRDALELEQEIVERGGCAAAVRSRAEWSGGPAGVAAAAGPLPTFDGAVAAVAGRELGRPEIPSLPAAGVRVLDLTRVIAGPVGGRTLAALGADVLRIDPPAMPELEAQHLDGDPGKRSALLDLADTDTRERLLAGADVLLCGYRPGSLARFGLESAELAERHPRLVQVHLSAWGMGGPWGSRRGFDSLVQAASGIAAECAAPDGSPGALPAQALDHASGHLMAAAALVSLARRSRGEPAPVARLSLARMAAELLGAPRAPADGGPPRAPRPDARRLGFAGLSLIAPPGRLDGVQLRWAHGPRPYGADTPAWG